MPTNNKPNRLIAEKSPYLLQHGHNPVHWYPWGQEAFDKAKRENKPVLVSIGYATCHSLLVFIIYLSACQFLNH
ncbi:DUF255 domain-containing protein [Bacillus safensis]|uniref:DUF255 domain-containing protein n=1 Tax=Bacillus safensis TaxID=561879 RepID=UPI003F7BD543